MTNQNDKVTPTDFEVMSSILKKIRCDPVHKHNPGWASQDRLIFSAADTRLCFSFDKNGEVVSLSWGPWQDMV